MLYVSVAARHSLATWQALAARIIAAVTYTVDSEVDEVSS